MFLKEQLKHSPIFSSVPVDHNIILPSFSYRDDFQISACIFLLLAFFGLFCVSGKSRAEKNIYIAFGFVKFVRSATLHPIKNPLCIYVFNNAIFKILKSHC